MSYFYIPKNYTNLSTEFICTEYFIKNNDYNQTLDYYETKIDNIIKKNKVIWDIYKDEYFYYKNVFCINNKKHKPVTKFNAINKTFYIVWELNNIFNFMDNYKLIKSLKTFHFSKCQTGVIQFLNHKRKNLHDKHMGIYGDEWRKNSKYLSDNNNINFNEFISYNFINNDSLEYFTEHYSRTFDIITFLSNNEVRELKTTIPNIKEKDIIILKIFYSLILQKKGGTLIFSIPDLFDETYYELFYIISSCYKKVIITKPVLIENTSKRKIVICSEYIENYDLYCLINFSKKIIKCIRNKKENMSYHLINIPIPSFFFNKLFEINIIMFQQTIDATLSVINLKNNENIKEQLEKLGKRSIQKSMFWCVQNNFDYDEKVIECINESI
jgi:hypothetical protein